MDGFIPLITQIISGAVGGNATGAALKNLSQGTAANSLIGILGGGLGGQILTMLGTASGTTSGMDLGTVTGEGGMNLGGLLANVAAGAVGGGALLAIVGTMTKVLGK